MQLWKKKLRRMSQADSELWWAARSFCRRRHHHPLDNVGREAAADADHHLISHDDHPN